MGRSLSTLRSGVRPSAHARQISTSLAAVRLAFLFVVPLEVLYRSTPVSCYNGGSKDYAFSKQGI